MELTCSFPAVCPCFASRNVASPLPIVTCSPLRRRSSYLSSQSQGMRLQPSPFQTLVADTAAIPSDSDKEHMPCTAESNLLTDQKADMKEDDDKNDTNGSVDENEMIRVCDKLIEVFMVDKPNPTDWRRLLAFSRKWNTIRPHFYKRCQERANNETNPGIQHQLLRLGRKIKEIDDDVQRHNELLEAIRAKPSEITEIVSRRRKDFTKEFFIHLYTVAESYYENPEEQNVIAKLGNESLAAVQTYDTATESINALNAAELKLQDILNSPSVDAACKKIDDLAQKNQFDSATALLITKAWSAAKESNMTTTEAKDVLFHLYKRAIGSMQQFMPSEVRILKYLLTIKDPDERMCALNDAFTPGQELEVADVDYLYTTPEKLYNWIQLIDDAYCFSRKGTLIHEARDLMNPETILRMQELKKVIQDKFM